ncbi:MAG TPA: APC family permease [Candidatus Binataceae bacterium]|nr:APC family permease [Candidatus Binataceae bacterium]
MSLRQRTAPPHIKHRLGIAGLVAVMYLIVSGGPYGIEDAVRIAGARLALILCAVVPLTLSLPTALMASELTALIPHEGGFYLWVKEALGPFAGFLEAYLTVLYTAVDMAVYPVLFATYLSFAIHLGTTGQIVLAAALVWFSGLLNILGIRPVGNTSVALALIAIAPFAVFVIIGSPRLLNWQFPVQPITHSDFLGALGGGLIVVIWNYCGWENLSMVAGELETPRRNYLRAILITLPIATAGYLLPLGIALSGVRSTDQWQLGHFAHEAYLLGGSALSRSIVLGGAVSAFAMFEAGLLWVSRIPFVLASERYLPSGLTRLSETTATPVRSILICCVVFTLLVPLGFVALVVLDVFFYMGALALEMSALVRLRRTRPERGDRFVAGHGRLTLALIVAAPILTWVATFGLAISQDEGKGDMILAVVLALGAFPAYWILRRRYGGPPPLRLGERPVTNHDPK